MNQRVTVYASTAGAAAFHEYPDKPQPGPTPDRFFSVGNAISFVFGALLAVCAYTWCHNVSYALLFDPLLPHSALGLPTAAVAVPLVASPSPLSVFSPDRPFLRRYNHSTPFTFVHIPKAAGTTLTENMKTAFRKRCEEVRFQDLEHGMDNVIQAGKKFQARIKNLTGGGLLLEEAIHDTEQVLGDKCFFGHAVAGPAFDAREMLMKSSLIHGARFRYILGHVPYGYCTFAERGCVYITVLREPMSRMYSHFEYIKRRHPAHLTSMCKGKCEDFSVYVQMHANGSAGGHGLDNMMTRMLSGDAFFTSAANFIPCWSGLQACDDTPTFKVTRQHLATAIDNLNRHFAVVGVMEKLDLWTKTIDAVFDLDGDGHGGGKGGSSWTTGKFLNSMENKKPDFDPKTLSPDAYQALLETQGLDMELYEHALKLVAKQEAELASGQPLPKA